MIPSNNNNLSVLPWYQNIDLQDWRKPYANGFVYPLITPANTLLPFQIIRPHRNNQVSRVRLHKKDGTLVEDITEGMNETGLQIVSFAQYGYDVIVYPALFPMATNWLDGQFYATLSDGVQTWYSEVFTVVQSVTNNGYIKIEWYDVENQFFDAGAIVYKNPNFKNVLYLCTQLGKPEYKFEEEGEERDGYYFPEKQISEKTYKCTTIAPEYLLDVMRLIRMADIINVTDTYGRIYNCDTFLITPKWQSMGNIASLEIEFETDTVVKKIARGQIVTTKGDYNKDFNNDFNNND